MHVALIELLRCAARHEESPLVATATHQVERRILQGTLGCPVCGAEYAIRAAVADFRQDPAISGEAARAAPPTTPNEDTALRLAAQLDLTEPGRLVLLFGNYARFAPPLSVMFDALCVAIDASPASERQIAEHASMLRIDATVPFARGSMSGAAVDAEHAARIGLEPLRSLLRPNGRLVAPADVPPPAGVTLVAWDEREWVGGRTGDVVPLRRAGR